MKTSLSIGINGTDRVLAIVTSLLREVIGEDWVQDIAIGRETCFGQDLELESIEFVALAERLQETFGKNVDFASWLSQMDLDQIINLKVGQVVDYITQSVTLQATA